MHLPRRRAQPKGTCRILTTSSVAIVVSKRSLIMNGVPCPEQAHAGGQIEGVRFVCVNCPEDYSLCAQCETLREHDGQHLFLKVYTPLPSEALHFLPLPNLYAPSDSSTQTVVSIPNWIRQRNTSSATDLRYASDILVLPCSLPNALFAVTSLLLVLLKILP